MPTDNLTEQSSSKHTCTTLSVAIPSPLRRQFDYLPTNTHQPHTLLPGMRLAVSFGGQKSVVGILISAEERISAHKLKAINHLLDKETPALTEKILRLCQWCANYYHYPLGEVCHLALPTLMRKAKPLPEREQPFTWTLTEQGQQYNESDFGRAKKQLAAWQTLKRLGQLHPESLKTKDITRATLQTLTDKGLTEKTTEIKTTLDLPNTQATEHALALNAEQDTALSAIVFDKFTCYLLDGITGSGKTEVYLQAIQRVLDKGQQALVLVPEIGLTPQTVTRFQQRFNVPVATLHSGINDKQRLFTWQDAKAGRTPIVIGTRSAIFTPLPNLGLIIVDEEHDLSYKQQDGVRYSARDTAIVRAQQNNIPIILGSATPSLETLHNAISGRFVHLHLTMRATASTLPDIQCIPSSDDTLSAAIIGEIQRTLDQQQQALVFINRRGFAPTLLCQDCHWISECPKCDSRMTLHKLSHPHSNRATSVLHCHHCGYKNPVPQQCPKCHGGRLQALGQGTQRSEEELQKHFPNIPILRIDRDSMSRKGELSAALAIINSQQPCILVGTQMLAKGHHFASVSLAVILGIDSGFFSSDFRGSERMGQLLTQVSGRAGRESHEGKVLLQTEFGDHPLLRQLIDHGYPALSRQLMSERQLCNTPPYSYLAFIRCHAHQASIAVRFLQQTKQHCESIYAVSTSIQYMGPLPCNIEKRNNRYYYYLQIKTTQRKTLHSLLHQLCVLLERERVPKGLHWLVDVDPQET